jgi:hypothetical protein
VYHFFLGYRHGNGEVEGFAATRFGKDRARAACEAAIREKVSHTPHPFDPARIIRAESECSSQELATLWADWKIIHDGTAVPHWPEQR